MNIAELTNISIILLVGIIVVLLLTTLTQGRFTRTKRKDKFRTRKEIGRHNVGKVNKDKTYRDIAKERNLEEARIMNTKLNPKVTKAITLATKDVREHED